ncbi:MAG: hypothetical protein ACTSP4_00915 [Candidatus Hodarchaeales archaeon]
MGFTLNFTGDTVNKVIDTQANTPHHDCGDNAFTTGSRQSVTGSTEYDFESNCLSFEDKNFPAHMTRLWDVIDNKAVFDEELDTPPYVSRVQLNFDPSVAAAGFMDINMYVNETVPILMATIRIPYKASDTRISVNFTFYIGDTTGYDIKNKGLIFKYKPDANGEVYDRGILVYRT